MRGEDKDLLSRLVGKVVVLLLGINVIVVFLQVIYRYILNDPLSWSDELSKILLIWITFLGAALAAKDGGEISLDTFFMSMPKHFRNHIRILLNCISIITIVVLIRASIQLFLVTRTIRTVALELPTCYLYLSFSVGGSLMVIYYCYLTIKICKSMPSTLITMGLAAIILLGGYFLLENVIRGLIASHISIVLVIAILAFLIAGQPIAIIMLIVTLVFIWVAKDIPMLIIPQRLIEGINKFPLLAIPFFMLAGELMNSGGITRKCVDFASNLVGHLRGGLAHVVVVVNMIMAGMSGSALADVSGTGTVLIPAMARKGYGKGFACSLIGASGTIGSIVPPSIAFIIYGVLGGVSITKLFLAGIVPGVLMGLFLMVASYIVARRRGYPREEKATLRALFISFKESALALLLPLIIIGGILGGVFTATEASVIAVVYALLIGWLYYKELDLKKLNVILTSVAIKVASVMFIIGAASGISWLIARAQLTSILIHSLKSLTQTPWVLLLLINIILLAIGTFMETISVAIILIPLIVPLVVSFGIDPVQYGVLQTLNLQIGLITPPIGMSMFLVCKIGDISIKDFVVEVYPFLIALLLTLALITYIPALSSFIPNLLMGGQ